MERKYGSYQPISDETKSIIGKVYDKFGPYVEWLERETAYAVAADSTIIDQEVLYWGASAINEAYMIRNTHAVGDYKSLKLRDFKDDAFEEELCDFVSNPENKDKIEIVLNGIKPEDIDKRKNFTLEKPTLFKIKEGKFEGLCFSVGKKTVKEKNEAGEEIEIQKDALFLDIANTSFDKLPRSWQDSNFDPFEFAYKLVSRFPNIEEDMLASCVHVYWIANNLWAVEYNDPMAVPYSKLPQEEKVKDGDNVCVAKVFTKELKNELNVNQEKCLDIVKIAKKAVKEKIEKEKNKTEDETL